MSIFFTMASEYVVPQEALLQWVPPVWTPIMAMVHTTTLAYMPMFLRIFVQRGATSRGYDNLNPRAQIAALLASKDPSSAFSRLHSTHINALESLPVFFAAMGAGVFAKVEDTRLAKYGSLYFFLRLLYSFAYFFQTKSTSWIRSLLYGFSLATSINLMRESSKKLYED
jgi:uncharacterized MAPEG superfamily protein